MLKPSPGQTTIPVPNAIGFRHDPDEAFEREYGTEALREQRRRYVEERACTCSPPPEFPNKWGRRWGHGPGCPRAGRKF